MCHQCQFSTTITRVFPEILEGSRGYMTQALTALGLFHPTNMEATLDENGDLQVAVYDARGLVLDTSASTEEVRTRIKQAYAIGIAAAAIQTVSPSFQIEVSFEKDLAEGVFKLRAHDPVTKGTVILYVDRKLERVFDFEDAFFGDWQNILQRIDDAQRAYGITGTLTFLQVSEEARQVEQQLQTQAQAPVQQQQQRRSGLR